MIESIKKKLWDILKEKDVSLALLFNKQGEILWHRGRRILGRTIDLSEGFSKTYLKRAIKNSSGIEDEDIIITLNDVNMPQSALNLNIKSLIIQPITDDFFLYIDSGSVESFSQTDREIFKVLGTLLGETIHKVEKNQLDVGGITGSSEAMQKIRELVLKYAIEEDPVLLFGETGVGKSHTAELIHQYSGRSGKFVTINTPSIQANLFESEVFGHKKGAFTDAKYDKTGFVDEAREGTLFFDEITEMPVTFQAKLLRFIDTKKYVVLGESEEKTADLRIVAATNRNIKEEIKKGNFREDLYYRLQVLEIEIPPLRERKDDIKALVMEMTRYLKEKSIGNGFWDAIYNYDWPGNIRELRTVLTRAGIHAESEVTGEDILNNINRDAADSGKSRMDQVWQEIKSGKTFWEAVKEPYLKREFNKHEVKEIINRGLFESEGKYVKLIKTFNLKDEEYHNFMSFLHEQKLR